MVATVSPPRVPGRVSTEAVGSSIPSPRGAALSSFGSPSSSMTNGVSKSSNVRVVARVRPVLEHERYRNLCLLPVEMERRRTSDRFDSPTKSVASQHTQDSAPLIRNKSPRVRTSSLPRNPFAPVTTVYGSATSMIATRGGVSKEFEYDAVFSPEATQKEVYERSVGDAVRRNIFRGYNTTIIAYGQSGSGKTYTMSGQKEAEKMALSPTGSNGSESFCYDDEALQKEYSLEDEDGIIPRAVHDLFKAKQRHESAGEVTISLTYLEIYNEELRDLLVDDSMEESILKIRDSSEDGFFVGGLTSTVVTSVKHARELMDAASTRRRTSSTSLNLRSSRSHAICTLSIAINPATNSHTASVDTMGSRGSEIISAKLTMVDLAGSERIKQSGVTGMAQKESININKDLFVLAKVVSALSENAKKKTHVPYRDSKLTRLLRDSLGGNCCTVVVACVSPSDVCFEESINTLRYAERTRTITNSVKQNVIKEALTPSESAALRAENKVLKSKLLEMRRRVRLLELKGGHSKDGFGREDDSQYSFDNLHITSSGDTEGSTISHTSSGTLLSMGGRLENDIAEKKAALERLDEELFKSERILQSKELLMDQSSDELVAIEARIGEVSASENRIARSLKIENDSLRKQNKDLMDSIRTMEAEMQGLATDVVKRKAELQDEVRQTETQLDGLRKTIRMEEQLSRASSNSSRSLSAQKSTGVGGQLIEMSMMENKPKSISPEEVESLQCDLAKCKREVETINAKLRSANARIVELEKMESVLRKQLAELYEDQQQERKYREQSIVDLETLVRETEKLKRERDEARIQAAIHCDEKEKFLKESKILKKERDEARNKATIHIGEIETLTRERETLEEQRDEARNEAALHQEEKTTIMVQKDKLNKEKDEARIRAAIHQDEKDNLEGSIQAKDTLIAVLRKEVIEYQQDYLDLSQRQRTQCSSTVGVPVVDETLKDSISVADSVDSALTDDLVFTGKKAETTEEDMPHRGIRVHATQMLFFANQAIEKGRSSRSVISSVASSNATELKPDIRDLSTAVKAPSVSIVGKPPRASKVDASEKNVVISNMDHVATDNKRCACQNSLFSGNAAHAEFYLPKLGMACSCGRKKQESTTLDRANPTALTNILRPWQVEFLATLDIHNGVEMVHAFNQRGGEISKVMRAWRKEQELPSVKTKSCHVALHIWSRTCKAVVRSVRQQKTEGAKIFRKPEFLEIPSDDRSMSTLGYGSVINKLIDIKGDMMEV